MAKFISTETGLVLGGLGLFIFSVGALGKVLKSLSGNGKFEKFISKFASSNFKCFFYSACFTFFIKSAGATSISAVNLVNMGLLSREAGLSMIIGSHIGSPLSSLVLGLASSSNWLTFIFNIATLLAALTILIFKKNLRVRWWADLVLTLSLFIFSLGVVKYGFKGLEKNGFNLNNYRIFFWIKEYKIIGFLFGAIMVLFLQSSSVVTGIFQVAGLNGVSILPLVFGVNTGAILIPILAVLGSDNMQERKVVFGNIFVKFVTATVLFISLFLGLPWVFEKIFAFIGNEGIHVYIVHLFFNVVSAIMFLPFVKYVFKFLDIVIDDKKREIKIEEDAEKEKKILN